MNVNHPIPRADPYSSLAPGAEEDDSAINSLVSSVATAAMVAATPAAASSVRSVIPRDFSAGCCFPYPCIAQESPLQWRLTFYRSSVVLDSSYYGGGFNGTYTYSKCNSFNPVSNEGDSIVVLTSADILRIRPLESHRDKFNLLYSWFSAWYGIGDSSVRAASAAASDAEPPIAFTRPVARAVAPSSSITTAPVRSSAVSVAPTVSSPVPSAATSVATRRPQNFPWVLPIDVLVDLNPHIHRIKFDTRGQLVVTVMNHSLLSPPVFCYNRDPALYPVEEISNNEIKITLANQTILKIRPVSQCIKESLKFVQVFKQFATYEGPIEELPNKLRESWNS